MTPSHIISRVKDATDLPALVSEYAEVRRALILCPWHSESNASCRVYDDHVYCFTCNHGGDCFAFLMAVEGIPFYDALQRLAERAGIALDEEPISRDAQRWAREEASACRWYWDRYRSRQMALIHANMAGDEQYLEALGAPLRWMDAMSTAERFTEFRRRRTERDTQDYRDHMETERVFAEVWMGLAQ